MFITSIKRILYKRSIEEKVNKTLKILFVFQGIFVFASALLGPLHAIYVKRFVQDPIMISFSITVFLLSSTFMTVMISRYDDIQNKQIMLMVSYFMRALLWILHVYVTSFGMLLFLLVLIGIADSLGSNIFSVVFAEHLDEKRHVRDYAYWNLVATPLTAIATLIGGVIAQFWGFEVLFMSMAVLAMISFTGIGLQKKEFFENKIDDVPVNLEVIAIPSY